MILNGSKNSSTIYMETHKLLDRFELLYPQVSELADLRRAYIDKDLSSIFRLVTDENKEDLRKLVMEDNTWKLWPLLERYTDTHFVSAFKSFFVNETEIWEDCFSRGQLQSKQWLVQELERVDANLGTVFLCAGWYATLATMLFESKLTVDKIRSFDIDPSCTSIANTFNKPWVINNWRFQASVEDICDINYTNHTYTVTRSNGSTVELSDSPDTIINTSCEHISNFAEWYNSIPKGKLVVLQSNNYFEVEEHVNCVVDNNDFSRMAPMTQELYDGHLDLEKYTRFMRIGYR